MFNSYVPELVPMFYYAIKHGYKIIIYVLIKKNDKLLTHINYVFYDMDVYYFKS